jgi:hypothetical protein
MGIWELGIMLLRTLVSDGVQTSRRSSDHLATKASYQSRMKIWHCSGIGEDNSNLARILQVLIEDFGGEATSASLLRRIHSDSPPITTDEAHHCTEMRAALTRLESCGALTLEDLDGTEIIARIADIGAILAYDATLT